LFFELIEWSKQQVNEEMIKSVFQEIRYPLISPYDLINKVHPTRMADQTLYTAALEYHHFSDLYDSPERKIIKLKLQIHSELVFVNLTPSTVAMSKIFEGTLFTKTSTNTYWDALCTAEVYLYSGTTSCQV